MKPFELEKYPVQNSHSQSFNKSSKYKSKPKRIALKLNNTRERILKDSYFSSILTQISPPCYPTQNINL